MRKIIFCAFLLWLLSGSSLTKAQWVLDYQFQLFQNQTLEKFYLPDTNCVWALLSDTTTGYGHYIYKRVNGQWLNINTSSLDRVESLIALDSEKVFVTNNEHELYYTSNSGQNWILKLSADSSSQLLFDISRSNPAFIYATSSNFWTPVNRIHKSSDYGSTWQTQIIVLDSADSPVDLVITDISHIWIGINCYDNCTNLKYMYSINGGVSWLIRILPQVSNNHYLSSPRMKSDNLFGLMVSYGYYSYIFKTTDSGLNWTSPQYFFTEPEDFQDLKNVDGSSVWYCATCRRVLKSTDDGVSWNPMTISVPDTDLLRPMQIIKTGNKVHAWITSRYGKLFKLTEDFVPFGIQTISNQIPMKFSLSQNYPNPFNPLTKIKFDVAPNLKGGTSNVKLLIYDILGREVAAIVNECLNAGSYEATWDASNYPSGVYFYSLQTEGFKQTKKLVLIK